MANICEYAKNQNEIDMQKEGGWVQGAHDEDDDDDGIAGSLLLEGVCLFCVSAIFELIFANLCPKAENVATKYLNMPRVRTANEMAYTTAQ